MVNVFDTQPETITSSFILGKKTFDNTMEFEAKSVRDGAWYSVINK